jgi:hypothetical protein
MSVPSHNLSEEKLLMHRTEQEVHRDIIYSKDTTSSINEEISKSVNRVDKLYDRWRDLDILTCFMAMLGLALAIVDVSCWMFD